MGKKYVYFFGQGRAEGKALMKDLLGGKGANLAEMTNLGVPVPSGFTITTEACVATLQGGGKYPPGLWEQVEKHLTRLERAMGLRFGDPQNPLLLSVRSGARISMPGMMDTILNLGLNDRTVQGLIARTNNPRFAYDSYRRFVQMFGEVVLGLRPGSEEDRDPFEVLLADRKRANGVHLDHELSPDALKELVVAFQELIRRRKGIGFPQDPERQLRMAVDAVFNSWNNPRAVTYRKIHGIPPGWGTAVNVQAMVFGNMGDRSATGVAFTRNPATGERRFYGEWLPNAQGEDVVAGVRTPRPIAELQAAMPALYGELDKIQRRLERHFRDMQDIEFTIQEGRLFLLQTRTGKRTAPAAVKIAVDMVKEKLIGRREALLRVTPEQVERLLHPMIDPKAKVRPVAKGLPASPGAAVGRVVFTAQRAQAWAERGEKVVLVRTETSPEDIGGMHVAQGILTARGGMTSHAAVVARGMGKPCVAGCGEMSVHESEHNFVVQEQTIQEGDWITIDGGAGTLILGQVPLIEPGLPDDFITLFRWADQARKLGVRTNADTPTAAEATVRFGAEGIGLCRTEHMFFEGEGRIAAMREMILAEDEGGRRKALAKLLPLQRSDFQAIFEVMDGLPVIIRLFDPPLHEFLPKAQEEVGELAREMGIPVEHLQDKIASLFEFNPMLGHRGCRLAITYPEITEMQARAIFEAAAALKRKKRKVLPEVMVPLVGTLSEFRHQRTIVDRVAQAVMKEQKVKLRYLVGTMIEIPRACLLADEIAREADFFSFGTNDLTQTVFGFSRDDAGKFLRAYLDEGILPADPFISLDESGVGRLMEIGISRGRSSRNDLEVGICGEHGGDPNSVAYCHRAGLDYVSCSPYRVPVAKLAAAQAAIRETIKVVEMGEK
ncbi:MAG: pyruvate, phosphate dikinase [Candidatus Methylomirabilales bacterium]